MHVVTCQDVYQSKTFLMRLLLISLNKACVKLIFAFVDLSYFFAAFLSMFGLLAVLLYCGFFSLGNEKWQVGVVLQNMVGGVLIDASGDRLLLGRYFSCP